MSVKSCLQDIAAQAMSINMILYVVRMYRVDVYQHDTLCGTYVQNGCKVGWMCG